jgi:hypothetical protein
MADLPFVQTVTGVALVAATQQTLFTLLAPTNQRVKISEISISFNGVSNTNTPVLVQFALATTTGTNSAGTPVIIDTSLPETVQTVTKITFTVEPTYTSIFETWYIHPQTGVIYPLPFRKPFVLGGGKRVGLLCNAPQAVSVAAKIEAEE